MQVTKFNAAQELTTEEQETVIRICSGWAGTQWSTVEKAITYALEDECALEEISTIADFGL